MKNCLPKIQMDNVEVTTGAIQKFEPRPLLLEHSGIWFKQYLICCESELAWK